ncbi:MAG TPA: aminotransferase class V-fold PLP-dependent enzyme [Ktedonobacteraceae bacterium]|nr:aminotransferase class V-fold PLP-dependent enzyme [Ktedonobacteraceae bacterium]
MSESISIQQIREALPVVSSKLYLNTGTFGPLPGLTIKAIEQRLQYELLQGRLGMKSFEEMGNIYSSARQHVATLLHAAVDEVALTDNTGEGLNIISYGFNWQPGDEVITTNHEHISALAPLYQLRDRFGIIIKIADLGPLAERSAEAAIEEQISEHTRLIVLSHVTWTTGAVVDVAAVAQLAHARGIPVLVDGAQSAGAIPLNLPELGVDFYAIPMQKWLCGPDGTGALYVHQGSLEKVTPTYAGYFSIKHEEDVEWEFNDNAQRFEMGGRQTAALAGQAASLTWMEETVTHKVMFERISALNTYACERLQSLPNVNLLTPKAGASGLVAFSVAGQDPNELVQFLQEKHNIYIRSIPAMKSLRISTGFYNTQEEIDTLLNAISDL